MVNFAPYWNASIKERNMQESIENATTESDLNTIDSNSHHDKFEPQDDTDADAFATLSLLLIIACTIVYYLGT